LVTYHNEVDSETDLLATRGYHEVGDLLTHWPDSNGVVRQRQVIWVRARVLWSVHLLDPCIPQVDLS